LKFTDKLKKSKKRSRVAYLIALLAVIYFLMTVIKGVYFWTDGSSFSLAQNINEGLMWIFAKNMGVSVEKSLGSDTGNTI
jgi:hypothetical protein